MLSGIIPDVLPSEMKRIAYADMPLPTVSGFRTAYMPALLIRARPFDAGLPCPDYRTIKTMAVLDTGATVSSAPMWMLEQMRIPVDEGSRRTVFGAGGDFDAYGTQIGIEIEHDGGWLDIGIIDALAPDTARSRDPEFNLPFLLGRRGFFDRFDAYFSESREAVWLRMAGGWPRGGALV